MPRMRINLAGAGLPLGFVIVVLVGPASAELIQSPGGRAYPDIAASITGGQSYTYDPSTRTGMFEMNNIPFLLKTGPGNGQEADVRPDAEGVRSQALNMTLDRNGNLIGDANNSYSLYGSVVVGGQTYNGLLLRGTPIAFGAKAGDSPAFNLDVKITGGMLASAFGSDVYVEIHPTISSRFDGNFTKDFATEIESSNTLGYNAVLAPPIPEPSTLLVLLACVAGFVFHRHRFRRSCAALGR